MDLGDFIIPAILIGGAVVQWLTGKKKVDQDQPDPYSMEDPFPKQQPRSGQDRSEPAEMSMDELMEALGQKPKQEGSRDFRELETYPDYSFSPPVPVQPVQPPPPPAPYLAPEPMVVRRNITETPQYIPNTSSSDSLNKHDDSQEKRFANFSSFDTPASTTAFPNSSSTKASKSSSTFPLTQSSTQSRFAVLKSKASLRNAIVINEILQPPVALR